MNLPILTTERLILRPLNADDAPLILELVNDPAWIRFIGDRNIHTLDAARSYILNGPMDMYQRLGFGLYLTALREEETPIGMCGLLKRDTLDDVDIGFAFLPQYTRQGYGFETAAATLKYAKEKLKLPRVVAITTLDNTASIRLLERLRLQFVKTIPSATDSHPLNLFSIEFKSDATLKNQ